MCATCGCAGDGVRVDGVRVDGDDGHDRGHDHEHPHPPGYAHTHEPATETVRLEVRLLAKNDALAAENRSWLNAHDLVAINLMSSPGAGKTTLLEATVKTLAGVLPVWVIEGDQETAFDAERIRATGAPVVQVNTGSGCHLDASMVRTALDRLEPAGGIVLIENVGNLVCPALFALGECARVVIMSVTEGADKPLKYPHIFASATAVLLNKIDLLPYVDFDLDRFERDLRLVNPGVGLLPVSATRGDGLSEWIDWLHAARQTLHVADLAVAAHIGHRHRHEDETGEDDQSDHDDRDESDGSHGTSSSGEKSSRLMDDEYTSGGSVTTGGDRDTALRLRLKPGRR
jgi:hydrogenase nickel incorporation protein HypB